MLSSKDINFVGYTYKNFEIVNDYQVPGMGISLSLSLDFNVRVSVLKHVLVFVSMYIFCLGTPSIIIADTFLLFVMFQLN